jgi:hypothetical protein
MRRQKIAPLRVDWRVGSSGGFTISMTDDEIDSELTFTAYFMRDLILYKQRMKNEGLEEDLDYIHRTFYRLLKVTFTGGWCYFAPRNNFAKQMMREKFDWSEVFGLDEKGDLLDQETYLDEYEKKWLEDEVCPNSAFYKVENSEWIAEVDAENRLKLKHYLIFGEDYYAQKLNWSNEQNN